MRVHAVMFGGAWVLIVCLCPWAIPCFYSVPRSVFQVEGRGGGNAELAVQLFTQPKSVLGSRAGAFTLKSLYHLLSLSPCNLSSLHGGGFGIVWVDFQSIPPYSPGL